MPTEKNRHHAMPTEKDRPSRFTGTAQAQFAETEKKIGDATLQVQNEFLKALEETGREVMSSVTAEVERGRKLSEKLTAARSLPDAMAAYQEWVSEEMSARAEDAQRFMTSGQKLADTSQRLLSSGWSSVRVGT